MTAGLPIALARGRTARCSACASPCQGTLRGPGELVPRCVDAEGDGGVYGLSDGPVLCRACHEPVWVAYHKAVRARKALIRLSWTRPGVRTADVERLLALGDRALIRGTPLNLFNSS